MARVAYRIVTPRLVLRCWEPRDAPLLCESIAASLEHLRATMLWAKQEPESVEQKAERLRGMRARFDLDQDYVMGAFDREERSVVGGTGLHPRVFEGGLEIGYWVDARHLRKGFASEMSMALTRVAFEALGMNRVEIHVDTRNIASQGVARKLGFKHEATLPERVGHPDGVGDRMIFTRYRKDYAPFAMPVEAFDAMGSRLL